MDRDLAIQIVAKITSINTSLAAIATNTTPAAANAKAAPAQEETRSEPVQEEPVQEEPKATRSTKK